MEIPKDYTATLRGGRLEVRGGQVVSHTGFPACSRCGNPIAAGAPLTLVSDGQATWEPLRVADGTALGHVLVSDGLAVCHTSEEACSLAAGQGRGLLSRVKAGERYPFADASGRQLYCVWYEAQTWSEDAADHTPPRIMLDGDVTPQNVAGVIELLRAFQAAHGSGAPGDR